MATSARGRVGWGGGGVELFESRFVGKLNVECRVNFNCAK